MKDIKMVEAVGFDRHFHTTSWQEGNKRFFDQLAPKYDVLNEIISLGQQAVYKRRAVQDLFLKPGQKALDLCTGTGDMAFLMAQEAPGVAVEAVDASEGMLQIALKRMEKLGAPRVHFQSADALDLPFADNSFDAVMVSFGLRNFVDMESGLKQAFRVLKPGGCFVALDLGKPQGWGKFVYHLYYERLMPWLGQTVFHRNEYNSYAYLSVSNRFFSSPEHIMRMMRGVGFKNVGNKEYMLGGVVQLSGMK